VGLRELAEAGVDPVDGSPCATMRATARAPSASRSRVPRQREGLVRAGESVEVLE
jgi:hypothetical protein